MLRFSVGRSPVGLLFSCLMFVTMAFGATPSSGLPAEAAEPVSPVASLRSASVQPKLEFSYAGSYLVDGKFEPASARPVSQPLNNFAEEKSGHPNEVPLRFDLHSREQKVENLLPRYRAKKVARGQSFWTSFRDNVVTFAYGHERILAAPQRVITDSAGRVIVVDPAGSAVHVLSPEHSFRIVTGPDRRIEVPAGVAVDRDDNIYVSDSARGVVAIFDASGKFLRYIGKLGNDESLFHYPTGIAIDRRNERLYVLDTERHLMFVMDLLGHEIRRVGRYSSNDKVVELLYPTEVAVGEGELAVLDSDGQRVWLTDLDGNPVSSFLLGERPVGTMSDHVGLAIDGFANLYVAGHDSGNIRVYNRDGRLLNTLAGSPEAATRITYPTGIWIDQDNHMLVCDQTDRRVEVFQLSAPEPAEVAGDAAKHNAESPGY